MYGYAASYWSKRECSWLLPVHVCDVCLWLCVYVMTASDASVHMFRAQHRQSDRQTGKHGNTTDWECVWRSISHRFDAHLFHETHRLVEWQKHTMERQRRSGWGSQVEAWVTARYGYRALLTMATTCLLCFSRFSEVVARASNITGRGREQESTRVAGSVQSLWSLST